MSYPRNMKIRKVFLASAEEKWRKVPSFVSLLRPEQPYSHIELWDRNDTRQQRAMLSLGRECNKKDDVCGGKQALLVDMFQRASVPFRLMERITMEYNFSSCIFWASLDPEVEENADACVTTEVTWASDILFVRLNALLTLLERAERSFKAVTLLCSGTSGSEALDWWTAGLSWTTEKNNAQCK